MTRPTVEVDGIKECRNPVCVWDKKGFRVVVVYNTSGTPPRFIIEKKNGLDAMGDPRWTDYPLPNDFPRQLLEDFVEATAGKEFTVN